MPRAGRAREPALVNLPPVQSAPGHPLEDFDLVADPDKNFIMTMKDGKIYKNALSEVGN